MTDTYEHITVIIHPDFIHIPATGSIIEPTSMLDELADLGECYPGCTYVGDATRFADYR